MALSNQKVLELVIQKAIVGGWKKPKWAPNISVENLAWDALKDIPYWQSLIFNHDFAKALWGDGRVRVQARKRHIDGLGDEYDEVEVSEPGWQHHLQQMVIDDDPIQYLASHIDLLGGDTEAA